MGRRLVLASTNEGKLRELRALLDGLGIEVVPISEAGVAFDAEETGATFACNAELKALAAAAATGELAVADDSGLEVIALGGQPGVLSSRVAPTDPDRIRWVLDRLRGVSDRRARFVCAIALANRRGVLGRWEGAVDGVIAEEPAGTGGFGYDPIFYYPPLGMTFGQLPPQMKNRESHRARALRAFREDLPALLGTQER